MTTLYRFARTGVALPNCLAESFAERRLRGLIQGPGRLIVLDWDGRRPDPPDLGQAYEARLFCESGELRWLRDPATADLGRAAWVSEDAEPPEGFAALAVIQDLETLPARILSYGERFPGAPAHAEIGGYEIREYIGRARGSAGEDGNMTVVEQRIRRVIPRAETGGRQ